MGSFIGIDLGTTFSVVAKIDEHGKPVIVPNDKNEIKNLTPSCVGADEHEDNEVKVGEFPRRAVYSDEKKKNAVGFFKREMGTSQTYTILDNDYTPTDLSALVLERMIRDCGIVDIEEVVVTVPANFANEAREATIEAAQRAGLNINYIINEPTAAALCYSFREGMNLEGIYAIYDLGGGTFDISIIRIKGKDVEVLTSNGVHKLGGIDFDKVLKELVEEKYQAIAGEALEGGDYDLNRAEEDKKELSKRKKITTKVNRKTIELTRHEFDELISAKVTQAEMLCESTLEEAGLKPADIRGVLCAGGSTRIPVVQESIKRAFNQDPIFKANVDEVVALGAALYAAYKGDHEKLSPAQRKAISGMEFIERTARYYGIVARTNVDGEKRLGNSILIKKNTKIPCEASHTYYTAVDGQTKVNCQVTEAGSEETDLKFIEVVGLRELSLPPGRPAGQGINVTFQYTDNQTMRCLFEDVETGEKIEILYPSGSNADTDPDINEFTVE